MSAEPVPPRDAADPTTRSHPGDGLATTDTGDPVGGEAGWSAVLAPPHAPDEIGRLGPYRVLRLLGRGGMGAVFEAEDPHLERRVALKVMLPRPLVSPEARPRFLREARAQARVEHEHVIPIFHVGDDRGTLFIAMPLLKGQTLGDYLRESPRPPISECLRVGREIAEGLAAAHEQNLIHRDVKPGNVWLEGDRRRVKLLDFGLARAVGGEALTAEGAMVGSPSYMSPEQARGNPVDFRTDLFSLGVVLYRLCTGELPFRGADPIAFLTALALDEPLAPIRKTPDLPPALSDLIVRLLAKDPAARPASAAEVVEAIRRIESAAEAAPPSPATVEAEPLAPHRARLGRRPPPHRPRRRGIPAWLVGAVGAVWLTAIVVVAGVALGTLGGNTAPTAGTTLPTRPGVPAQKGLGPWPRDADGRPKSWQPGDPLPAMPDGKPWPTTASGLPIPPDPNGWPVPPPGGPPP